MHRMVVIAIVKMVAEAVLLALLAGLVIGILGYLKAWDTAIEYSNAFFLAGSLMIVAGGLSRLGAGQGWGAFQAIYAESFRDMTAGERAQAIVSMSSTSRMVILGVLSGLLLILVAAILA